MPTNGIPPPYEKHILEITFFLFFFIKVPVPIQESVPSYICVLGV